MKVWYAERVYHNVDLGIWDNPQELCKKINEWIEEYKENPWKDTDGPYPLNEWIQDIFITEFDSTNSGWMNPVTMDWDGDRPRYRAQDFLKIYDETSKE